MSFRFHIIVYKQLLAMHISKIPSDIIRLILQQAYTSTIGHSLHLSSWKNSLALLAVCQNWRQLALPSVYSCAIVSSKSDRADGEYGSNLQLIVGACASQRIKQLKIMLNWQPRPQLILETIINIMSSASLGWRTVDKLDIYIPENNISAEEADALVKQFSDILPNIMYLTVVGVTCSQNTCFYSGLANIYMPQLKTINASYSLSLAVPERPKNLSKLVLCMPKAEFIIPNECAEALFILELINISSDYDWSTFIDPEKGNATIFSNLQSLFMFYMHVKQYPNHLHNSSSRGLRRRIYFPKLQNLELINATENCNVLKYGVLPSTMNKVTIEGTEGAFAHLSGLNITRVNKMNIYQPRYTPHTLVASRFIRSTKDIIGNIKATTKCKLVLYRFFDQVDTVNLNWPNLTHLLLHEVVNATIILKIIPRLPRLEKLCAYLLNVDVTADHVCVPLPSDTQLVTPIDSKIKELVFSIIDKDQSKVAIDFAKYLLLHLPWLLNFEIIDFQTKHIEAIANSYKNRYPHLANVKLSPRL